MIQDLNVYMFMSTHSIMEKSAEVVISSIKSKLISIDNNYTSYVVCLPHISLHLYLF